MDVAQNTKADSEIFEDLFKATYPRVLAYVCKLTGETELARDICQEIYITLWEKQRQLPASSEEQLYYIFTTARNAFYQYTRRALRQQKEIQEIVRQNKGVESVVPGDAMELAEQVNIIRRTLGEAAEVKTKFFLLNREEGMTYKQIAEQEGVSEKTVERYIGSIVKALRTRLASIIMTFF